jgi:calcineurin-like phosphoesterase family protein
VTPDFVWSDQHFGHAAVIEYSARPFANVSEMNETMIRNYNSVVGNDDTVLWVGDCFFAPVHVAAQFMSEMNGRKILVRGNHDGTHGRMKRIGFYDVFDEYRFDGFQVTHFHYDTVHRKPLPVPRRLPGLTLLHGHTHSTERASPDAVHVGVDAWNYTPVSLSQIRDLV